MQKTKENYNSKTTQTSIEVTPLTKYSKSKWMWWAEYPTLKWETNKFLTLPKKDICLKMYKAKHWEFEIQLWLIISPECNKTKVLGITVSTWTSLTLRAMSWSHIDICCALWPITLSNILINKVLIVFY